MSTVTGLIKRRRRPSQPLGEGQSSREASAESNDETNGESDDLGDEVSISPSIDRDQLSSLAAERGHHHNALHLHHPDPSQPTISQPKPQLVDLDGDLSAGHDGDVSSATAISADSSATKPLAQPLASSSTSRPSPAAAFALAHKAGLAQLDSSAPPSPQGSPHVGPPSRLPGHGGSGADASWAAAPQGFLSNLTAEEIQDHIRTAIAASDPAARAYRIKEPPVGRPVRIYADGVYDLLHYGHMLQLRQCKLAFPEVYLMVGVCSDELVRKYKASPVMTSNERYESVRHCKWVDEVVEDAPWTIDQAFLDEHQIDYVAHDEEPYMSAGSDDVYAGVKALASFLPTKRTNGVSTSELLQRIVEGYREGEYDSKFIKLGLPELCSHPPSTRGASEAGGTRSDKGDKAQAEDHSPRLPAAQGAEEEELATVVE